MASTLVLVPSSAANQTAPTGVSAAVTVAGSLADAVILQPRGRGFMLLTVLVAAGGGPLTNLALTRAAAPGGTHVAFATGVAINQGTNATALTPGSLLEVSAVSPYTAAAGTNFQLLVDTKSGQEYKVQAAASTGTNTAAVTVEACLVDGQV